MPMYQRPPFWRVPHQRRNSDDIVPGFLALRQMQYSKNQDDAGSQQVSHQSVSHQQHSHQQTSHQQTSHQQVSHQQASHKSNHHQVTPGTPAGRELLRGDIIAKIDDYDSRDLRHEDAQNLFKNASNQIRIVVQRDADRQAHMGTPAPHVPRSPVPNAAAYRTPSPLPTGNWQGKGPESLPRTPIPPYNNLPAQYEGEYRYMLSPTWSRTDESVDESIGSQPYRTTPLVLPGAKVRREPGPTESYLRHHPNPSMRAPPHHDYRDTLMKQRYVHKQFNSPINLYSDQNVANSVRQQTSPLPYKPTVVYDPASSETYRALQEAGLGGGGPATEVPTPALTKVFTAPTNKRPAPPPKPKQKVEVKQNGKQTTFVSTLNEESIQQSNSFKRLMYNVLSDTDF